MGPKTEARGGCLRAARVVIKIQHDTCFNAMGLKITKGLGTRNCQHRIFR